MSVKLGASESIDMWHVHPGFKRFLRTSLLPEVFFNSTEIQNLFRNYPCVINQPIVFSNN
jgi:hypothetical protein